MTTLAMDMCEQVPYSASLAESTQVARVAAFRARPPVASPVEVMKIDRDARIRGFLVEAISEARASGTEPKLSALENFEALLRLLPADLPVTDPYISQSGSICLDWDFDSRSQLSVLLKDKNQIAFAAYFSGERVHGSTRFSSHELPEVLATVAKRWSRSVNRPAPR